MARLLALALALLALATVPTAAHAASFPGWGGNPDYFATPSSRVVCEYGSRGGVHIHCTDFSSARDEDGDLGQRVWGVRRRGSAFRRVLVGNAPVEAERARYGVTYRYRGITCRIHRLRGITCRNRDGHGFTVSADRQRLF